MILHSKEPEPGSHLPLIYSLDLFQYRGQMSFAANSSKQYHSLLCRLLWIDVAYENRAKSIRLHRRVLRVFWRYSSNFMLEKTDNMKNRSCDHPHGHSCKDDIKEAFHSSRNPEENISDEEDAFLLTSTESPPSLYVPRRYIMAAMLFLGLIVAYSLRVVISIAAAPVTDPRPGKRS